MVSCYSSHRKLIQLAFLSFFFLIFIYLWLCWVFVSVRGLSPVVASGGHSSSRCTDLSLSRPLLLRSTGSRRAGSAIVAHGPSCSAACGIFPDQGSNPCSLPWQADSQPLRHQGSPYCLIFNNNINNSPPSLLIPLLEIVDVIMVSHMDFCSSLPTGLSVFTLGL